MKRILLVFGTRPEAIKMAPLVKAFEFHKDKFASRVCVTAQHREMLDQVLEFFEIIPDYDLDLMKPNQSLNSVTADILIEMKPILEDFKPDYVLVHGDTATSTAAALAAYFAQCKVGHIEAGLRTYNKWSPFPEEMNRQITSRLADLHFAPTQQSRLNLLKENIPDENIIVTGNSVIDALVFSNTKVNSGTYKSKEIDFLNSIINQNNEIILVTGHRRENFGDGFVNICNALKTIAKSLPNIQIIYPVHLNPKVHEPVYEILSEVDNILLIPPLSYPSFVWLLNKSKLILTDSGGIQEEAPSLGKPVLVMRETTERPEAVEAGTVVLVGTDEKLIIEKTLELLSNNESYIKMSKHHNPYGDGKTCEKIVNYLMEIQ